MWRMSQSPDACCDNTACILPAMNFRTITAKYAGRCRRCNGAIVPGSRIRYAGRGMTYHLSAECPGAGEAREPAFAAADRAALAGGVSIARNYQGEVIAYRNARGRCEDAPCCGCCSA